MSRPLRFEHYRWLGDKRTLTVHDLDNTVEKCRLDELLSAETFATFGPDSLVEARNRCYRPCRWCASGRAATA